MLGENFLSQSDRSAAAGRPRSLARTLSGRSKRNTKLKHETFLPSFVRRGHICQRIELSVIFLGPGGKSIILSCLYNLRLPVFPPCCRCLSNPVAIGRRKRAAAAARSEPSELSAPFFLASISVGRSVEQLGRIASRRCLNLILFRTILSTVHMHIVVHMRLETKRPVHFI